MNCDVLVIGSGAAGLTAALAAAHHGLRVLLLERETLLGGTSALSGGWVYAPGHRRPGGAPPAPDTREEVVAYLRALAGPAYRADRVDAFLDAAPEMVRFLEDRTRVRFAYPEKAPDYHLELPGARIGGRAIHSTPYDARRLGPARLLLRPPLTEMTVFGVVPQIGADLQNFLQANSSLRSFGYVARRIAASSAQRLAFRRTTALSNGNALVAMLLGSANDAGVEIRTGARVRRLHRTADRVDGADVTIGGRPLTVRADRGVILASGGFSHDEQLTKEHFPHGREGRAHHSMTIAANDGDGIRLAEQLGAAFESDVVQPAAWAPVTVFDGRGGRSRRFPHLRGIGLPGLIAIDRTGRRFGNEADSYHDFGQAIIRAGSDAYLIGDARTMHKYGIGYAKPWPMPRLRYHRNGYLATAPTLAALAADIGVDPAGLQATVEEYNRHARTGRDPEFHRGESAYNTFRGDPAHQPNPSIGPVVRAPFHAVRITIGDLGTFAGLSTDPHSRVLDSDGRHIPGLYAAGSVAVSVFGGAYPGYGAMLGHGMTSGFVAARHLARPGG